jgi:hypothetical protein
LKKRKEDVKLSENYPTFGDPSFPRVLTPTVLTTQEWDFFYRRWRRGKKDGGWRIEDRRLMMED